LYAIVLFLLYCLLDPRYPLSFPTRRSSDLTRGSGLRGQLGLMRAVIGETLSPRHPVGCEQGAVTGHELHLEHRRLRILELRHTISEEHTSELQSRVNHVCRLLLEQKRAMIS